MHQNEVSGQSAVPNSAQQLQSQLERQQNITDEVVQGLHMPQR